MKRWLQNCGLDVDPTPCLAGESWAQPLGRPDPSGLSWGLISVNGTQPLVIRKNRKDSVDRHIK